MINIGIEYTLAYNIAYNIADSEQSPRASAENFHGSLRLQLESFNLFNF
jgi:hypothetical protein